VGKGRIGAAVTTHPKPEDGDRDDEHAFERFFKAHHEPLYRRLMRHLRNPDDARDMVQETFARLLEVDRIKLIQQPVAYLLKMARRAHRKLSIRAQREPVTFSSEAADQASETLRSSPPNELLEEIEAERQLIRAICELSPMHQNVLELYVSGLSVPQIAEQLELSIHTVRKYVTEVNSKIKASCSQGSNAQE
jgi:RNA polymerase sigma factor (sigma-70 family)